MNTSSSNGHEPAVDALSTYCYGDTAIGTVAARNVIRNLHTWDPPLDQSVYATYMRYSEDLVTYVATHRNNNGKPTVAGYDGLAWTDVIPEDFDAVDGDLGSALTDARRFITTLESRWDIDPASLRFFYSGGRSIHIEIPTALLGGLAPAPCGILARQQRRIMQALTRDLNLSTLDWSMYNKHRLWRLEGSRHRDGRFKIPLTYAEVMHCTAEAIQELALCRRRDFEHPPIDDWRPVPALVALRDAIEAAPEPESSGRRRSGERQIVDQEQPWWSEAVAIIADGWPATGRHAAGLGLGGALAHAGWDAGSIKDFLADVTVEAMGQEGTARGQAGEWQRIANDSVRKVDAGDEVTGWPTLAGIIGDAAADSAYHLIVPAMVLGDEEPDESDQPAPASSRPEIQVSGRPLDAIAVDAITALAARNDPSPQLFVRAGALARVIRDERGRPRIETLTRDGLLVHAAQAARWMRYDGRIKAWKPGSPPENVLRYILARGVWPFPALTGITETPILRPDGSLLTAPGYDPATSLFYAPAPGFALPEIAEHPTDTDVAAARTLVEDVIADFPFDSTASRANALGLLVTPVIRSAIDGLVPLALLDKNTPGTGATFLAEVIARIATGRKVGMTDAPAANEEMEKRITTLLRDAEPFIIFDNVDRPIDHASLSLGLTAPEWAGRILGRSEAARFSNLAVWIATGNNLRTKGDIARRAYRIRMEAAEAQPWRIDGRVFRHPDLVGYVTTNRGALIGAVLTLARAWFAAGCPKATTPVLGMFEAWSRVIGGILAHAGIIEFLANLDELYAEVDDEATEWEGFLRAWRTWLGDGDTTARELANTLRDRDVAGPLHDAMPATITDAVMNYYRHPAAVLGRELGHRVGRRYGPDGLHLTRRIVRGQARYRVISAREPPRSGGDGGDGEAFFLGREEIQGDENMVFPIKRAPTAPPAPPSPPPTSAPAAPTCEYCDEPTIPGRLQCQRHLADAIVLGKATP
jgi:hypothetical protein